MNWNSLELPDNPYYQDDAVVIYHGDCREILPDLPKVDLVLTDPPYGITANKWDKPISAKLLWGLLGGFHTCVLTAGQPFSSDLICGNVLNFKHEWIWLKNRGSNFANTVREPMKEHEHILVFSSGQWTYNPQMQDRSGAGGERVKHKVAFRTKSSNYRDFIDREGALLPDKRVPSSVQFFETEVGLHPTQKPTLLFSYLINTYSNIGDLILDPFLGSGTTAYCAKKLNRKCIGIEIEEKYCEIAAKRCCQTVMNFGTS